MNHFTEKTYNKIVVGARQQDLDTESWYKSTYEHYLRILESNKLDNDSKGFYNPDDFVVAASFAFSWLARIPRLHNNDFPFVDTEVVHYFYEIDSGNSNPEMDEKIITRFVSCLDNSVVAVSKMVHFLSPNHFPIIDSKVIETWNHFFPQHRLPKKVSIHQYLQYAQLMRDWSSKSGVSLRELEVTLFNYEKK